MRKFSAVITEIGAQKLAAAALTGNPVGFTTMAVGDGGGTLPNPDPASGGLINERYRAQLNKLVIADQAANVIEAEIIMPPQAGGYWLREVALFDADGNCMAVGNMPETYKPLLAEGSGRHQVIRMWLAVSSTGDVQLIDNPAVILATMEEIKQAESAAKDYTDTVVGEIEEATEKAIAAAIKDAIRGAWELDNPVGTSRLFNQNINPNDKWPWSKWEYTGEGRTVRIAKRDGSNVGQTGGSDTVTITRENLPAEKIAVSGTANDTDLGTKRTKQAGRHAHHGTPKRNSNYELGGNNRVFFDPYDEGDTDEAGEHEHEIDLGQHGHNVTGETDALGSGQAVSIVESHVLQMCWHRIA